MISKRFSKSVTVEVKVRIQVVLIQDWNYHYYVSSSHENSPAYFNRNAMSVLGRVKRIWYLSPMRAAKVHPRSLARTSAARSYTKSESGIATL